MHHSRARKILADQEMLDIAATAEAVQEDVRLRTKKGNPRNPLKALKAHAAWLAREHAKEELRLRLKTAWNKHKKYEDTHAPNKMAIQVGTQTRIY